MHPALRDHFLSLTPRERDTRTTTERVLSALGVDPVVAEAVLGDLLEERARRSALDGEAAARAWYVLEFTRSLPSLALGALRHLSPEGRLRLAAWMAGGVLLTATGAYLLSLRAGSPAHLIPAVSALAGGVVVNNERGKVQLPLHVLDEKGRSLPDTGVRFAWISGAPVSVSPDGALACPGTGDAVVRASLGSLATDVRVLCRPVSRVVGENEISIMVGGPAYDVAFLAEDATGKPVTTLTGALSVRDTSIVRLESQLGRYRIHARTAGSTGLDIRIGDEHRGTRVTVYEPVATLEGLRSDHPPVAVPVRLASGEARWWRVSRGFYTIEVLRDGDERVVADLSVVGANCLPGSDQQLTCASAADFWVVVRTGRDTALASSTAYVALRRN